MFIEISVCRESVLDTAKDIRNVNFLFHIFIEHPQHMTPFQQEHPQNITFQQYTI